MSFEVTAVYDPCDECRALVMPQDMEAHRDWHRDGPSFIEISYEKGRELFDKHCQAKYAISGEAFLNLYDAGVFESEAVMDTIMLIPFARETP